MIFTFDGRILLLYGSQTGTAQAFAEKLSRELYICGISADVLSLEDGYTWQESLGVEERIVLFITSTTGEGAPPESMRKFWRFIMWKDLPVGCLEHLRYGVFGLGDSSFEKFNVVGKKLDKRLEMLGGKRIIARGEGDDQHEFGPTAAFSLWKENLWSILGISNIKKSLPYRIEIQWASENETDRLCNANDAYRCIYSSGDITMARIASCDRLTAYDHSVDVREYVLHVNNIENMYPCYLPGDIVDVYPNNEDGDIIRICELFDWNTHLTREKGLDTVSGLKFTRPDAFVPPSWPTRVIGRYKESSTCIPISFWDMLKYHLHISHMTPSQTFFEFLYRYLLELGSDCPLSEMHMDKLYELSVDMEQWIEYCWRPKRRIIEILQDFFPSGTTVKGLSPNIVFDLFPWIRPRSFSISCAQPKNNGSIILPYMPLSITVSLVHIPPGFLKSPRYGFCSAYLQKLCPGDTIPIHVRKGTIQIGPLIAPKSPLILLCAGVGISPIRSLLQFISTNQPINVPIHLFFGYRYRNKDYLYMEELESLERALNNNLHVHSCGSRDANKQKVYIQHMMIEQSGLLCDLILNLNACLYLCGSTRLIKGVRSALHEILGTSVDNAVEYVSMLESRGRFQIECW
jgi:sulfite reductase alpha subunit-like flavoprotein